MPCYDPETHEFPQRAAAKINLLTQILCEVGTEVESRNIQINSERFNQWIAQHKRIDSIRERYVQLQTKHRRSPTGLVGGEWQEFVKLGAEIDHWDLA